MDRWTVLNSDILFGSFSGEFIFIGFGNIGGCRMGMKMHRHRVSHGYS
jgi:hypothetical protein